MAVEDFVISVLCDNGRRPGVLYYLENCSPRKDLVANWKIGEVKLCR